MSNEQSKLMRHRKNFSHLNSESQKKQNSDNLSLKQEEPQPTASAVSSSEITEALISIPLSDLSPDPNQARHDFSKIAELKESIRINGQLQPITVVADSEGKYFIKDGECRWRAMKLLAEESKHDISSIKIKAIYKRGEIDENVGLIINLIRNDYSPFEVAFALKKLQDAQPNLTLEQIGRKIGKSRQNVGEYLNLLRLPEKIQQHAIENNIIPFYILKQLAANPRLSEQEKIDEYDKLLASHSSNGNEEAKDLDSSNTSNAAIKNERLPINKKFNTINKKLDSTIKAFEKFKIENIETKEDRQTLSAKLEKIIDNANKLKEILDADE